MLNGPWKIVTVLELVLKMEKKRIAIPWLNPGPFAPHWQSLALTVLRAYVVCVYHCSVQSLHMGIRLPFHFSIGKQL